MKENGRIGSGPCFYLSITVPPFEVPWETPNRSCALGSPFIDLKAPIIEAAGEGTPASMGIFFAQGALPS
jgi:hypothetical protein